MVLAYAKPFIGEFESSAFNGYAGKPLWSRYIDDTFIVWTHGEEKLNAFIIFLPLFFKPTDRHQYLLHSSGYAFHTKK